MFHPEWSMLRAPPRSRVCIRLLEIWSKSRKELFSEGKVGSGIKKKRKQGTTEAKTPSGHFLCVQLYPKGQAKTQVPLTHFLSLFPVSPSWGPYQQFPHYRFPLVLPWFQLQSYLDSSILSSSLVSVLLTLWSTAL